MGGTPIDAPLDLGMDVLIRDVEANNRYVVPEPLDIPCGITAIDWDERVGSLGCEPTRSRSRCPAAGVPAGTSFLTCRRGPPAQPGRPG